MLTATTTEAEAFNALCKLLGERLASEEMEDNDQTASQLLQELTAAAAECGEAVQVFASRLYGLD